MKTRLALTAILAGMMFFTACENAQKTGADVAIKAAQSGYAAVADQATQYVPDQAKDVQSSIQKYQRSCRRRFRQEG
jgi:predicted small secreted protein